MFRFVVLALAVASASAGYLGGAPLLAGPAVVPAGPFGYAHGPAVVKSYAAPLAYGHGLGAPFAYGGPAVVKSPLVAPAPYLAGPAIVKSPVLAAPAYGHYGGYGGYGAYGLGYGSPLLH